MTLRHQEIRQFANATHDSWVKEIAERAIAAENDVERLSATALDLQSRLSTTTPPVGGGERILDLVLQYAVRPKQRPQMNRKTGAVFTPKETKEAEKDLAWELAGGRIHRGPVRGYPVAARIDVWHSGAGRRGDLDNRVKLVLDAANEVMYEDDRQVIRIVANSNPHSRRNATRIQMWKFGPSLQEMELGRRAGRG